MSLRFPHPASIRTRACVESLAPSARRARTADLFDALARGGRAPGSLLLESADVGSPDARRSLIVPEPLLRLTSRGADLAVDVLADRGGALLEPLAERLSPLAEVDLSARGLVARLRPPGGARAVEDRLRLIEPSVLDAVRALVTLVEDDAGEGEPPGVPIAVYGALAYELALVLEGVDVHADGPLEEPDLNLVLALDAIELDHERGTARVTTRPVGEDVAGARERAARWAATVADPPAARDDSAELASTAAPALAIEQETDLEQFASGVGRVLEHIAAGDVFQAVLSRSQHVASGAAPLDVYRSLTRLDPSPYMFHFELGDGVLLGASPECCVRVAGGEAELRPIAGTAPRGRVESGELDADLDTRLAAGLLLDPKEQAEHAMLVDLARNDLARICASGSREVRQLFQVEAYSHVQHLVSRVAGRLDAGLDALDAYRACANMGTLTGAPKLRAMEILRELEPTARGTYGGAIGVLTRDGDLDSCIVIRSLRERDGTYTVRTGAGVVADSSPEREALETQHKAGAALRALQLAELGAR